MTTLKTLKQLFETRREGILSVYFTAGYPALDSTASILKSLSENKVDLVEIGVPFSDPLADGPTIQCSNELAIANGITLPLLLDQLKTIIDDIDVPIVLMGYLNPILQYGVEPFLKGVSSMGIAALIVPDLLPELYESAYKELFEQYGVSICFLITPHTSEERIHRIDALTTGFIYMVTTAAVTGEDLSFQEDQLAYFERIQSMQLSHPVLAGFGIRDKNTFDTVCKYARGGIIGSAFIKALQASGVQQEQLIYNFIQTIRS